MQPRETAEMGDHTKVFLEAEEETSEERQGEAKQQLLELARKVEEWRKNEGRREYWIMHKGIKRSVEDMASDISTALTALVDIDYKAAATVPINEERLLEEGAKGFALKIDPDLLGVMRKLRKLCVAAVDGSKQAAEPVKNPYNSKAEANDDSRLKLLELVQDIQGDKNKRDFLMPEHLQIKLSELGEAMESVLYQLAKVGGATNRYESIDEDRLQKIVEEGRAKLDPNVIDLLTKLYDPSTKVMGWN